MNVAYIVPIVTFSAGFLIGFVVHFLLVEFKRRDG